MTREEAIRVFGENIAEIQSFINCAADPEKSYPSSIKFCEALGMAIDALREQDSNTNQHVSNTPNALKGWISVKDRLPEVERSYLTYTDKGRIIIDSFCIYPEHGTKFWVGGNGKVTHWMPLPEPPTEEEV